MIKRKDGKNSIRQSDLVNRVNVNGACIDFDYFMTVNDKRIRFRFEREIDQPLIWSMMVVIKRNESADSQVYSFSYQLPKQNMDLTMVAAMGLKCFQMYLKEEIQLKSNIDFAIGEIVNGMQG